VFDLPEKAAIAARETAQWLAAMLVQIRLLKQRPDGFVALACILNSLECRKMIEHILGRNLGIKPKLLWQIAQHSPNFIFLLEDIN